VEIAFRAAVIDSAQVVAVPEQSPPQLTNTEPGEGRAVSVTGVPWSTLSVHEPGHEMVPGAPSA
jgi:hypothetical protein